MSETNVAGEPAEETYELAGAPSYEHAPPSPARAAGAPAPAGERPAAPSPDGAAVDMARTYRGASLEEVLPRIRAELGPDAVVLRQREGLVGGVGGFFQRRCVEVEARAGAPRVDVYDEGGEAPVAPAEDRGTAPHVPEPPPLRNDAATREGLASPGVRQLVGQAQPFADLLGDLVPAAPAVELETPEEPARPAAEPGLPAQATGRAEPAVPAEPAAPAEQAPRRARTLRDGLVAAGLGADLADDLVAATVASRLPFSSPGRLLTLVRDELAARLTATPAAGPGRRALAVVGPAGAGKTAAVARIAAAHAAAGTPATCVAVDPSDGGAALTALLAGSGVPVLALDRPAELGEASAAADGLLVVDTPPAFAGSDGISRLARRLRALELDEVHVALRAGSSAAAGAELLDGLAALAPTHLLPTALGETAHLGAVADVALRSGLALSYVAEDPATVAPADVRALAARVVR